eukprot:661685-Pyramimonas_sp.AAC.1
MCAVFQQREAESHGERAAPSCRWHLGSSGEVGQSDVHRWLACDGAAPGGVPGRARLGSPRAVP